MSTDKVDALVRTGVPQPVVGDLPAWRSAEYLCDKFAWLPEALRRPDDEAMGRLAGSDLGELMAARRALPALNTSKLNAGHIDETIAARWLAGRIGYGAERALVIYDHEIYRDDGTIPLEHACMNVVVRVRVSEPDPDVIPF